MKIILIFSSIFLILILSLLFFNNSDNLVFKKNSQIDFIIKNSTWETWYKKEIPYKKWDIIEINIIPKNWLYWDLEIDYLKLPINIKKASVKDNEININKNISLKKWEWIKIIWEAKNNWILKNDLDIFKKIDLKENQEQKDLKENLNKDIVNIKNIKISFDKYNLNSNLNNLINIYWTWIENIKYINIWWISFYPIKDNNEYYLSINKNTFSNWEYFIILQLKDNSILPLNDKISFIYSKDEVNVYNITPNQIKWDKDTYVVIQWNWLSKIISLQFSNNVILKNTSFNIINDNVLSVKIPANLEKWKYYINIMTTKWIFEIKNTYFYIVN